MKNHALKMTRPEFLKRFISKTGAVCDINEESLEGVIPSKSKLIYAAYTILMEQDYSDKDIKFVNVDDESVAIKLADKDLAKELKSTWHKEIIRLGSYCYKLKLKVSGQYAYVSIELDHAMGDEDGLG